MVIIRAGAVPRMAIIICVVMIASALDVGYIANVGHQMELLDERMGKVR